MRVMLLECGTFSIEADPSGVFSDPANTPQGDPARAANIVAGAASFGGTDITVDRATSTISASNRGGRVLFTESLPLTFVGSTATQHLAAQEGEQFLGGGTQNGRSIHTCSVINIANSFHWDDDGYPNAVPYYMTSRDYGVLRNTFAPAT